MLITLELPDEIGMELAAGRDLPRAALEALIAESCREHRISEEEAAKTLGLSRHELDGLLKQHGVYYDIDIEDIRAEVERSEQLLSRGRLDSATTPSSVQL